MSMPGMAEMLVILGIIVLLFGGSKLPKLGGALGESIRNFKKGVKDDEPESLSSDTKAAKGEKSKEDAKQA